MLGSLGLVLVKSSNAAEAYERAIAWKDAIAGATHQAAGTRQQQASQALFVATGEARYKAEWEQGVAIAERSGAAVEKLHDPTVTKIAQTATEADRKHDAAVTEELFPAMERNDMAAAYAALAKADRYVRIPLEAQEKIEAYVSERQASDIAAAKAASASARRFGLIAGLLATLLAAAVLFVVSRGIRRSANDVLDRLSSLETNDAAALQEALDAVAGGDLTQPITADTPAIANPGTDEIGDIARATNGIRVRLHASVDSYNGMRPRLAEPDRRGRRLLQLRRRGLAPHGRHVAGDGAARARDRQRRHRRRPGRRAPGPQRRDRPRHRRAGRDVAHESVRARPRGRHRRRPGPRRRP